MKTYYDILEVSPKASQETIKAAYKSLMKRYHPDVSQGGRSTEKIAKEINNAYDILKSPEKRAKYDEFLKRSREQQADRTKSSNPDRENNPRSKQSDSSRNNDQQRSKQRQRGEADSRRSRKEQEQPGNHNTRNSDSKGYWEFVTRCYSVIPGIPGQRLVLTPGYLTIISLTGDKKRIPLDGLSYEVSRGSLGPKFVLNRMMNLGTVHLKGSAVGPGLTIERITNISDFICALQVAISGEGSIPDVQNRTPRSEYSSSRKSASGTTYEVLHSFYNSKFFKRHLKTISIVAILFSFFATFISCRIVERILYHRSLGDADALVYYEIMNRYEENSIDVYSLIDSYRKDLEKYESGELIYGLSLESDFNSIAYNAKRCAERPKTITDPLVNGEAIVIRCPDIVAIPTSKLSPHMLVACDQLGNRLSRLLNSLPFKSEPEEYFRFMQSVDEAMEEFETSLAHFRENWRSSERADALRMKYESQNRELESLRQRNLSSW